MTAPHSQQVWGTEQPDDAQRARDAEAQSPPVGRLTAAASTPSAGARRPPALASSHRNASKSDATI